MCGPRGNDAADNDAQIPRSGINGAIHSASCLEEFAPSVLHMAHEISTRESAITQMVVT